MDFSSNFFFFSQKCRWRRYISGQVQIFFVFQFSRRIIFTKAQRSKNFERGENVSTHFLKKLLLRMFVSIKSCKSVLLLKSKRIQRFSLTRRFYLSLVTARRCSILGQATPTLLELSLSIRIHWGNLE